MRVCYFGTYREEYSRNQIMIEGLRRTGIEVIICHEQLWFGIEDRIKTATGGWLNPRFWIRLIRAYFRLLIKYFKLPEHDIIIIGYPGQLDVFIAKLIVLIRRKPIIWDIFMSIYLISLERELNNKSKFSIELLRLLENIACKIPDRLVLDTQEYVSWFSKTHRITPDHFRLVPTGADERIFYPTSSIERNDHNFQVIYFGTYIPNHGVETIIESANRLKEHPTIKFVLVGDGPDRAFCQELAHEYQLTNISFVNWLSEKDLVHEINLSDSCLGVFGITPQSMMTIQNKVYIGLAMKKPVITGESPTIKLSFKDKKHLLLCRRKDPDSLASAIVTLAEDRQLCEIISTLGYEEFKNNYDLLHIGMKFKTHIQEVLEK